MGLFWIRQDGSNLASMRSADLKMQVKYNRKNKLRLRRLRRSDEFPLASLRAWANFRQQDSEMCRRLRHISEINRTGYLIVCFLAVR